MISNEAAKAGSREHPRPPTSVRDVMTSRYDALNATINHISVCRAGFRRIHTMKQLQDAYDPIHGGASRPVHSVSCDLFHSSILSPRDSRMNHGVREPLDIRTEYESLCSDQNMD